MTAPASGATVSATITVSANASDNVGVAGVQFTLDGGALGAEDTTAPYAATWNTTTASNGSHTLSAVARDAAGNRTTATPVTVTVNNGSPGPGFAAGDLVVSNQDGSVQWRHADGSLIGNLAGTVPGPGEGMGFGPTGYLYVSHWCADGSCSTGDTVERFDPQARSTGPFGSGYCRPHSIAVDVNSNVFVGQTDCSTILKFTPGQPPVSFTVATENAGVFWMDLAGDGCTAHYTSQGPNVKRFDVCANRQLADFNRAPLPGGVSQAVRLLPFGGLLVSSGDVIVRLDSAGNQTQTFGLPGGGPQLWAGIALVGDGTFWAINYYTSDVYRFDLSTGSIIATFNTGTAPPTVVDIEVSPGAQAIGALRLREPVTRLASVRPK